MPPSKGSALVRGDEAMRLSDEKLRRTEIDAVTAYQYYARYGVLPTSAGLDAIERIAPLIAEVRAHRTALASIEQARNKRPYEQWPSTKARCIAEHDDTTAPTALIDERRR